MTTGLECLGSQSHQAERAAGPGAKGVGGACGCGSELRRVGLAVVAAETGERCGCGMSGGQGEGLRLSLTLWDLGSDPDPGGCGCPVALRTAPDCYCWEHPTGSTG